MIVQLQERWLKLQRSERGGGQGKRARSAPRANEDQSPDPTPSLARENTTRPDREGSRDLHPGRDLGQDRDDDQGHATEGEEGRLVVYVKKRNTRSAFMSS